MFFMELYAAFAGLLSVATAAYLYLYVSDKPAGSERMVEISEAIRSGANAYLRRQFMALGVVVLVMAFV